MSEATHDDRSASRIAQGLDGLAEFGESGNWISFDASRGKMVCRSLQTEYDGFVCVILDAKVVRVMKDRDGTVLCASNDRVTSDTGRPDLECKTCPDRDRLCFVRWRVTWQDDETGIVFVHTLSTTASFNFQRYGADLNRENLHPSQVLTRIRVEQASRRRSGTTYKRLQFERIRPNLPDEESKQSGIRPSR